jgi:hypothetical protein
MDEAKSKTAIVPGRGDSAALEENGLDIQRAV